MSTSPKRSKVDSSMADFDVHAENEYYDAILQLVKEAGNLVRHAFNMPREEQEVSTKSSPVDLVTETDKKVEQLLFKGLAKRFPRHKFIGEESASEGVVVEFTDAPTWIIDPIDGTTNFVHRIPFVCISVGLTIKKQMRLGIVYNPISDELYTARAGMGAYKNGFRIHTSATKDLGKAVSSLSLGLHNTGGKLKVQNYLEDIVFKNAKALAEAGFRGHRSLGSAAINMCLVAEGCMDCFFEFGIHCWDMAGAALIIIEAGGTVIDTKGGPFDLMSRRCMAASSKELAKTLSSKIVSVDFPKEA